MPMGSSVGGASREEIKQLIEEGVTAKLEHYLKENREFKRQLILLLSQMRQSQEISQEAFDKLNVLLTDFITGDRADLNSF